MIKSPPLARIKTRVTNKAIEQKAIASGLDPVLAKIIANRNMPDNFDINDLLKPKLSKLSNPNNLVDIEKAANRVADAIVNAECIGLETDHDCDGQTSHAVLYYNLVKHFKHPTEKIKSYIGHRLKEGYGLSESVANRILADENRPNLVITADNGSTDEPRIRLLKENNIDVVVTDHHQIPVEGIPKSAYACLNPTRVDCNYKDPFIAGCMVAWLLMVVVRQKLITRNFLPSDAPKLSDSLDFVALGTVADCVSMAQSANNRIVVAYGMHLIQKGVRPCWQAIKPMLNENRISSEDLSFKIAPLLNSDGRLSSAFGSVSFLLSEDLEEALSWVEHLAGQNVERKAIQKEITTKSIDIAINKINMSTEKLYSLCLFLEDGHTGVQGISASRIKDLFGLPTACLAPKQSDASLVSGSLRGIDVLAKDKSFNVKTALQYVDDNSPGMLLAFGGHKAAGGVTLKREDVDSFTKLFEQACKHQLLGVELEPLILTDGKLTAKHISLDFLSLIKNLEPYGREFENPIFDIEALLVNLYPMGDGSHFRLSLKLQDKYFRAVWFNVPASGRELAIGDNIKLAFSLSLNSYRGNNSCEIMVASVEKLA